MKLSNRNINHVLVGVVVIALAGIAPLSHGKRKITDPKLKEPNKVTQAAASQSAPAGSGSSSNTGKPDKLGTNTIRPRPRPGAGTVTPPPERPIQAPPAQTGAVVTPPSNGQRPGGTISPQGVDINPGRPGSVGGMGIEVNPGYIPPVTGAPGGGYVPHGVDINPAPGPGYLPPEPAPVAFPSHGLRTDIWTDSHFYRYGDPLQVFFRANRNCYVYIFNVDTRGRQKQIFPNHFDRDNYIMGGETYAIPDRGYNFNVTVEGRGGSEKLHIIAVAERYNVCQPFNVLRVEDPFPLRSASSLLLRLQGKSGNTNWGLNLGVHGIDVNPAPVVAPPPPTGYVYAENHTFYEVRPSGYYVAPPVHPPVFDPPVVIPPVPRPLPGPRGDLRITTTPSDAVIWINREYKGHSPLTLRDVPFGNYKIYVEKNGYEPTAEWVRIDGRGTAWKNIHLQRDRRYNPRSPQNDGPRQSPRNDTRDGGSRYQPRPTPRTGSPRIEVPRKQTPRVTPRVSPRQRTNDPGQPRLDSKPGNNSRTGALKWNPAPRTSNPTVKVRASGGNNPGLTRTRSKPTFSPTGGRR